MATGRAADDLDQLARDVTAYTKQSVKDVGKVFADAIKTRAKRDTGGDMRLSGVPGMARMTVSTTARVSKSTGSVKGAVKAGPRKNLGPWRWLNDGTRPHVVNGRSHPGTAAKNTWDEPRDRVRPNAELKAVQLWDRKIG